MGIRGLNKYLRAKYPLIRRAFLPTAGYWAVDASCIMYRARGANLNLPSVIANLIVRLRKAGGEPIFVFDGAAPAAKAPVLEQRRAERAAVQQEVTALRAELTEKAERSESERADVEVRIAALQKKAPTVAGTDRDAVKQLLHAAGVLFVTTTGEADDLLGFLSRRGFVAGVISTDMDMLARGVGTLVIPETPDCSVMVEITLMRLLSQLGMPYAYFVNACQLMGSDYTPPGWRTLDPAAAFLAVKQPGFSADAALADGAAMLQGYGVTLEGSLSEKQKARWNAGGGTPEPDVLATFASQGGWPRDWLTVLSGGAVQLWHTGVA